MMSQIEASVKLMDMHLDAVEATMDTNPDFAKKQIAYARHELEILSTIARSHEKIVDGLIEKKMGS